MIQKLFGSMTARIFLILATGTVLCGLLVMFVTSYERRALDDQIRIRHTVERLEQLMLLLDSSPASAQPAIASVAAHYGVRITFRPTEKLTDPVSDSGMTKAIRDAFSATRPVTVVQSEGPDCSFAPPPHGFLMVDTKSCERLQTVLKDGTPVLMDVSHRRRPPPPLGGDFALNLFLFLGGLCLLAWWAAHMATKPIRKLASAARALSNNIENPPLPAVKTPHEVRDAVTAFNNMQSSIRQHIEDRTHMLAAIAHDLQTPLTRLRLRFEKVQDEALRGQLIEDLGNTQAMIQEGLEFARISSTDSPRVKTDLNSMVESVCNDAIDAGFEVHFEGRVNKALNATPHALRRCLCNVLDNALKYGRYATVRLYEREHMACIDVEDGGEGIPEHDMEAVFQPFKRMENSRSRNTGGTGLGLTTAKIIIERHGGAIALKNLRVGRDGPVVGLRVTLSIPL